MARANRHYIPGYVWHITHRGWMWGQIFILDLGTMEDWIKKETDLFIRRRGCGVMGSTAKSVEL